MFDFKAINEARTVSVKKNGSSENNYQEKITQGHLYFKKFEKEGNLNYLKNSAELFADSIKIKSNLAEPYYNLAVIFYMIGDKNKSLEYFETVKNIDINYPGLKKSLKIIMENN